MILMDMKECPKCKKQHTANGRFCSSVCSHSRAHSAETKLKISTSAKAFIATPQGAAVRLKRLEAIKATKLERGTRSGPKPIRVSWMCPVCSTELHIPPANAKIRKFCNGRCRNSVNNKYLKGSRSKAEVGLEEAIKQHYPDLEVISNDRTTLDGLELDFYFPTLKLAIEWNGIYHLKAIRGAAFYNRYKDSDTRKKALCLNLGIDLLILEDWTSSKAEREQLSKVALDKIHARVAEWLRQQSPKL